MSSSTGGESGITWLLIELLHDPTGRWFLYVGCVVFMGVVALLAFLSVRKWFKSIASELGVVKHEVKNNHDTNLREEADERHDSVSGQLDTLMRLSSANAQNIATMAGSINSLVGRVEIIEQTHQPEEEAPEGTLPTPPILRRVK